MSTLVSVLLDLFAGDQPWVRGGRGLPPGELGLLRSLVGFRLRERGFRLVDGDLIAITLDRREEITLFDDLTLGKRNPVDGAGNTGGNLHLLEGVDAPRRRDGILHVTLHERRDLYGVLQLLARTGRFRLASHARRRDDEEHPEHDRAARHR